MILRFIMSKTRKSLRKLPRELMTTKLFKALLDDFSFFGSIPFYLFVTLVIYFLGNQELFLRLLYTLLIGFVLIIIIKRVHYKDRPQKEVFDAFMEKIVASSFPSTHSMTITSLLILLTIAYPFIWVGTLLTSLALIVYAHRYMTKKHYMIDIIGGIVIALIITIFVVKLF
jgi:undecaprenyl-diphosphatase